MNSYCCPSFELQLSTKKKILFKEVLVFLTLNIIDANRLGFSGGKQNHYRTKTKIVMMQKWTIKTKTSSEITKNDLLSIGKVIRICKAPTINI